MARQQLNDEEIKVAIAARFGCRSEDVILVSRPVRGAKGHYIGEKIYASVPAKDEIDTVRENIKEAFKEVAHEAFIADGCDGECENCESCKDYTKNDYCRGLAVAAAIFADKLGIEVIDL